MYTTDRLKQIRKEQGYTIYEMARMLGITPSFYSQIENKRRRLFYDTACLIAQIFNMKPDEIFYLDKEVITK
ncbi:MAG: helix-turn-helix transcriptional regulator [Firmicutes bacterium]|nr:helix-turn-helix transcriptional regulator [Bacillota bacterium]